MKKIILSAFKAFGGYAVNPTEIIADRFNKGVLSGFDIVSVVFESVIPKGDRGGYLLSLARRVGACGIVSLGIDSGKKGLCVENLAVNRIFNEKYCPSFLNDTPVDKSREYMERLRLDISDWNIKAFADACRSESISVMDASDAVGGFCCNHLIYQVAAQKIASQYFARIPFAFMHSPCSPESVSDPVSFARSGKVLMSVDDIVRGLEILLEHSLLAR